MTGRANLMEEGRVARINMVIATEQTIQELRQFSEGSQLTQTDVHAQCMYMYIHV